MGRVDTEPNRTCWRKNRTLPVQEIRQPSTLKQQHLCFLTNWILSNRFSKFNPEAEKKEQKLKYCSHTPFLSLKPHQMHHAARRRSSLLDGRPRDPEFYSSHGQWFFPIPSTIDRLAEGHTQPPNQWVSVGSVVRRRSDQKRKPYYPH